MTAIEFNPQQVKRDRGYCYVILFSDGVIKAGSTIDAYKRYLEHRLDATREGKTIDRVAITGQHKAYKQTEAKTLVSLSEVCSDSTGEYFKGVTFSDAIRILKRHSKQVLLGESITKTGSYTGHKIFSLRFNEDEYREVEQAAKGDHLKVSTWIKQTIKETMETRKGQEI